METGDWHWKRLKREGFEISILRIIIIYIPTNRLQSTCCGFYGIQRDNYFGGKPISRTEVEIKMGKLRHGKVAGKNEVTGRRIKGGGDRVVDWIWPLRVVLCLQTGGLL